MRPLIWSNTFTKAYKRMIRKHPGLNQNVEETLRLLVRDPFASQIETHKLKGKLLGSSACSVGYDFRIVFDFVKYGKQKEDAIFLIEIGTYDEVY